MQVQKLTVEEICTKLKPVFGKKIDEIYMKYAMAETKEEREEIEHILNALYHKNLSELLDKKVLLEPPSRELMDGEYPLAVVSYADKKLFPFTLREHDWVRHLCISGMSGSGKTTLAFHVIKNFMQKEKPFLIFDWKRSFRPLMLVDPEILCFTLGNENVSNLFRININQPPEGVSPKEWINVLCDLITESFFASYGVHKILLETLDAAFKDLGVYNGSKNYPTWNEIKWRLESKLEKTKGRSATWLESALRIAHVLTFGNFGKVLNYKGKEGLTVEDLFDKKVIFELNSLGNIEKKFFCEFLLTYIYKFKKARQGASDKFDHVILVDEAHNIFLKEKTHFVKESVTDMIYREMREYGTSLICLDQHISKISDTVAGNSACHIAFQQQLPQDIETISGLMQLAEHKNYFSMLPVGSAIVKLAERYTQPFLVEVEPVALRSKDVSDMDIKNKMKLIFEGRKIEQGKDPEFAKAMMQPTAMDELESNFLQQNTGASSINEAETEEVFGGESEEKLRAPNHALFNGEFDRFRKSDFIPTGAKDCTKSETAVAEINTQLKIVEEPKQTIQSKEIESAQDLSLLNRVQQILLEFINKKQALGWDIRRIERILEEHAIEGGYSIADVFQAVNYSLRSRFESNHTANFSESVTTLEKQNNKIYKPQTTKFSEHNWENSDDVQKKFLIFLQENPQHDYSTIELYNKLRISARKGNKIKNELLELGKIKIEEIKNSKGWRKIIRLA